MNEVQGKAAVTESGSLEFGVEIDGVVHRSFVMRAMTLNDVYRAAESVPVPDTLKTDQAAKIAYQVAFEDAQVLGQLVALGELDPVPSPAELVALVYPDDMSILRGAAESVKKSFTRRGTARRIASPRSRTCPPRLRLS